MSSRRKSANESRMVTIARRNQATARTIMASPRWNMLGEQQQRVVIARASCRGDVSWHDIARRLALTRKQVDNAWQRALTRTGTPSPSAGVGDSRTVAARERRYAYAKLTAQGHSREEAAGKLGVSVSTCYAYDLQLRDEAAQARRKGDVRPSGNELVTCPVCRSWEFILQPDGTIACADEDCWTRVGTWVLS